MTIAAESLGHRFGPVAALDGVTIEAAPGRITAIIGPNAAGKTTLLRCLIGGLRPTEGRALIDGEPAHRQSGRALARRVAYVAQRSVVSAGFTVREVVELGRYALPPSRAAVEQALDQLDLRAVADRPYPALSVGQQQRAALARAVAQLGPDGHLVLDEPTSAMDLRHVRDAARLLRGLADAGATVITALHDLALAAAISDDCWLMDAGRLAAGGPTREVMELERLESVFGLGFEWVERSDGRPVLVARE